MKKFFTLLMTLVALFAFSVGASAAPASKNNLSSDKAKELALVARQIHWDVMSGGTLKPDPKCDTQSFEYKGTDYRYLCGELSTKKSFTKYLNQSFTLNSINKAIKKYGFIEHKGKMAQPNADGGSILDWKASKAKLIYSRKDVRQFEFTVPVGETKTTEKKKVTFVKVNNKWQINDFDAVR